MSQPPTHNDDSINANVVTFVIMTCFVVVSLILLSQLPPASGGDKVALAAATVEMPTVVPSVTPLPPTHTPPPTETPTVIPTAAPTEPPPTATDAPTAAGAVTTGAVNVAANYDPALIERGQQQFMLCAACHGPDGHGIPNLGKDLIASDFVHSQTDEELLTFIKTGRPIWDPLNTTGIDMPPKGGNPAMTDDDILAVIAYIRSLTTSG